MVLQEYNLVEPIFDPGFCVASKIEFSAGLWTPLWHLGVPKLDFREADTKMPKT